MPLDKKKKKTFPFDRFKCFVKYFFRKPVANNIILVKIIEMIKNI